MTYRQYIREVMYEAAPRFDGNAERLSWMRGHLQHYEKRRQEIESREAGGRDWWLSGDPRWGKVA